MTLITGTDGGDVLWGTVEDDIVNGGAGNDIIQGGSGDDRIDGGTGSDTIIFDLFAASLTVDLEAGTATGEGNDRLVDIENVEGGFWDDVLIGNDGANRLTGSAGADTMSGGGGNDAIDAEYLDFALGGAVDRVDGSDGDDVVIVAGNDIAEGGAGFDTLNIGLFMAADGVAVDLGALWSGGAATIGTGTATGFEALGFVFGSRGDDVITIGTFGSADDAPTLVNGHGGDDRLTGGEHRELLGGGDGDDALLGLGGDDHLIGIDGDDRLEGGTGDDILNGGPGADVLVGGLGNDIYEYGNDDAPSADRIVERPDEAGADRILISLDQARADDAVFAGVRNIEIAELVAYGDLTGSEFVLGAEFEKAGIGTIVASADIDASQMSAGVEFVVTHKSTRPLTVSAGSGDDSFRFAPQTLPPFVYDYALSGGDGFDTLYLDQPINPDWWGNEVVLAGFESIVLNGEEILDARMAAVSRSPDPYHVILTDEMMDAGTLFTIEGRGLGGTQTLRVDVSQLSGGRAVRVLAGAAADRLTGSVGGDVLLGGGGDDELDGARGADRLAGESGNDVLRGGDDADRLDGGAGADLLIGGAGDDHYVLSSRADRIVEHPGQGVDTVEAAFSFTLPAGVETLILTGRYGYDGRGNAGANTITGNAGANFLSGGSGNDIIFAGAGNDRILGGAGQDDLKGNAGADRFEFTTALGAGNVDDLLDFSPEADSLYLLRTVFTRAGTNGTLAAGAFRQGAAAADASDRIVYDPATGGIYYDSDGNGAAAQLLFATVSPGTALTHADFVIYG